MDLVLSLFLATIAAALGGFVAKNLKLPVLIGYIFGGIAVGIILPNATTGAGSLAEIGTILLLFSIGIELSFERLSRFFKVAVLGAVIQIVLVGLGLFFILSLAGFSTITATVLALGFSLSSTAVVVKILSERGELETIHGGIMLGWLLIQDLAVIPMMIVLPVLGSGGGWLVPIGGALGKALVVISLTVLLGKFIVPYLLHKIAATNSREVLLLSSIGLALGTAAATSVLGISPSLGAFLAGVVISESQENHAIFAETRPLRDLFVALFFVSLGFLIEPAVIFSKFPLILLLALTVLVLKSIVVFAVNTLFGYKGRTAVSASLGLSQIGEFAFVILSFALSLSLISSRDASLAISVVLVTLIVTPLLFKSVVPIWRFLRKYKLFASPERRDVLQEELADHIIICGYGRVGKWVGRALSGFGIPFVVIEYNQEIVKELTEGGTMVLYGDPTEPEVLEAAGIRNAKAVILAIPDRVAQETLIAYAQTVAPNVKIISRVHLDEDWEKLKSLRVDKIVQPEFEAAIEIIRSVLISRGKTKDEIKELVKSLRVSHSK